MTQNIAFYLPALDGGDSASATYALARELKQRDYSLQMLTTQTGERDADFAAIADVTLLESAPVGFPLPALTRAVRAKSPDVLIAVSTPCIQAAAVAKRLGLLRPRLVGWEHFLPSAVLEPDQNATAPLIRWLYRACDDLLLPSQQAKELFATQFAGKPAPNLHVVPAAVAESQNTSLTATELTSLARLRPPIIASVGQFDRAYDFRLIMRAFQYFSRTNDGTLLLIGEGAGRAALDSAATGFGLGNRVVIMEARSRTAALLSKANVYISALHPSAFDAAMIQALRLGLPVVASDAPGGAPRAILADGRYGKLAPDGDAHALAQILRDIVATPATPETQRSRGAEFSVARAADMFLAALSEAPAREQAAA